MGAIAKIISGISFDTSNFSSNLKGVQSQTDRLESSFDKLGKVIKTTFTATAIVGGITAYAKKLMSTAGELTNMAAATGATVEGIQMLSYEAKECGVSQQLMDQTLQKIGASLAQLQAGSSKTVTAFAKLGLTASDFNGLATDQALVKVAHAAADCGSEQDKLNALIGVFGEELANKVLPILQQLSTDGFEGLAKAAKDAWQVMDEEAVKALNTWNDDMAKYQQGLLVSWARVRERAVNIADAIALVFSGHAREQLEDEQRSRIWRMEAEAERRRAAEEQHQKELEIAAAIRKQAEEEARLAEEAQRVAAIEEARAADLRALEEDLKKAYDALGTAQERYNEEAYKHLSAQEQLEVLLRKQKDLEQELSEIHEHDGDGFADDVNNQARILDIKTKQLQLEDQIKDKKKEVEDAAKSETTEENKLADAVKTASRMTEKQAESFVAVKDVLATLNEDELATFLKTLERISTATKGMDFNNLQGLQALSTFRLPDLRSFDAKLFASALNSMMMVLKDMPKNVQIPDLTNLIALKDFKLPQIDSMSMKMFAGNLRSMMQILDGTTFDTAKIESITNLLGGLENLGSGGTYSISLTAPDPSQLVLSVPEDVSHLFGDIKGSLSRIANWTGVLFR